MTIPATRVAAAVPATRTNGAVAHGRLSRPGRLLRVRHTPDILWLALGSSFAMLLVLFLVARGGLSDVRAAAQTIGSDSEPSVVAARQIGLSLANMHASAANAFLIGPGLDADALNTYQQERHTVANTLVDAAQNITYPGEKDQLRLLGENFVRYQELVSKAQAIHPQDPAAAMGFFGQANDLLQAQLFPAANELARINNDALDQSYRAHRGTGVTMAIVTVVAGLVMLALLVATQLFLTRRTRRTLNLPLVGASLLTVVLVAHIASTLAASNEHLRRAKQDAYDSVYALTSARTISYDANADESLWLLARADLRYETSFMQKVRQMSDPLLTDSLVQASSQAVNRHQPVPFKGYLADELNNITFSGEGAAALSAAMFWSKYLAVDGQIRSLERAGDHAGAVALNVGIAEGQSNWAFGLYDQSMATTIDINQKEFDRGIAQIFSDLGGATSIGADTLLPIYALLIAALTWLGLQPRIAEYR